MISNEEGLEWAKLRGHTTLEAYNQLACEYTDLKEKHELLIVWFKDLQSKIGAVIDEYK